MSESQSLPDSGSPVENKQGNSQNETVPKHSNNDGWKTLARKVPAKVKATRTYQSPPFSKEVYNLFVSALKYGEPAYPLTKELRKAGFHTSKGTSHRKKFRRLLTRFELHVVQGALVFSPNLEEDVLVHKRTGKILVAKEDVETVILRAHLWGSNEVADERMDTKKCKHFTVRQTHAVVSTVMLYCFEVVLLYCRPGGGGGQESHHPAYHNHTINPQQLIRECCLT